MSNKLRPSLTREQLHNIGQRRHNPAPGDVQALLWEIALLHCIARRADQYLLGESTFLKGVFRTELDALPCIQEAKASRRQWEEELAARPPEGRKPKDWRD